LYTNAQNPHALTGYTYDYMLKDHLGNTRAVLTEEVKQDIYPAATLEPSLVATENSFYTIDQTKIVPNSAANYLRDPNQQPQTYPNNNGIANNNPSCGTGSLCTTDNSANLYQLNSNTNKTGLGITLKVMAGDKIDVLGKSYYFTNNPGSGSNNNLPVLDLLAAFLNAPAAAATTGVHGAVLPGTINTATGTAGINSMMGQQGSQSNAAPLKPKAFINVIFFDEQFKAVDYRVSMVGDNSTIKDHYADLQNLVVPKSGFVYIYCSNETPVNVFFDNMQVVHTRSPILEETHYYPFGLTMAGISSKAAGSLENKRKWNAGSELNTDFDINLYETHYRSLDPQIGRFWQIDPRPNPDISLYSSMGNNPISFNDPLGDTLLNKRDQRIADRIERRLNKTNASLAKEASRLNGQIAKAEAKGNTNRANNLNGRLKDVNARMGTNTKSLSRLDGIRNDQNQGYTFKEVSGGSGNTRLETMDVNGKSQDVVVMRITDDANAVHEITHAHQGGVEKSIEFLLNQGKTNFFGPAPLGDFISNFISERDAYQAQEAAYPGSLPSVQSGYIPNTMNGINPFYIGSIIKPGTESYNYPLTRELATSINSILLRVFSQY
jgi:RHS repeat-associated protein